MLRRFDDRDPNGEVLGEPDPGSRRGLGPYRLDGEAVAEDRVVPRLIEPRRRKF